MRRYEQQQQQIRRQEAAHKAIAEKGLNPQHTRVVMDPRIRAELAVELDQGWGDSLLPPQPAQVDEGARPRVVFAGRDGIGGGYWAGRQASTSPLLGKRSF